MQTLKVFIVTLFLAPASFGQINESSFNLPPSGEIEVRGVIEKTPMPDIYKIGKKLFVFADSKSVNGQQFDQVSKDFLVGKEVVALLKFSQTLELTAVVPAGLYSIEDFELTDAHRRHRKNLFKENKTEFITRPIGKDAFESATSYRQTIKNVKPVKAGDRALIITFSGAQGDSFGAVMGHFSIGQAVVLPDGGLNAEITNFYPVKNEKEIKPGHGNLIDYFGHLTSGQANYRPTVTAIIYGVSAEELSTARSYMDNIFKFLYENPEFKFSINQNCSTAACLALEKASGEYMAAPESLKRKFLDKIADLLKIKEDQKSIVNKILYFFLRDRARFLPRKSIERVFANAVLENDNKMENISRIDLVFHGQIPSGRKRGGLAPGGLYEYAKAAIEFKCEGFLKKLKK